MYVSIGPIKLFLCGLSVLMIINGITVQKVIPVDTFIDLEKNFDSFFFALTKFDKTTLIRKRLVMGASGSWVLVP